MSSIPTRPKDRGHLPKTSQKIFKDCRAGAACKYVYCRYIHPKRSAGTSIPGPITADCYRPHRPLKKVDTNINQSSISEDTYSPPTYSPVDAQMEDQQQDNHVTDPGSAASGDPRRRSTFINQNDVHASGTQNEMSRTETNPDKIDIEQPVSRPQDNQMKQTSSIQTSQTWLGPASMTPESIRHTDDDGKQTNAHIQDDLPKFGQGKPSITQNVNLGTAPATNHSANVSPFSQESGMLKLPNYKAISEILNLRWRVSEIERHRTNYQTNVEKYRECISKAKNPEETAFYKQKHDSDRATLQLIENDYAKVNTRAKIGLMELATWIEPIPRHETAIAVLSKSQDESGRNSDLMGKLINKLDDEIRALNTKITEYMASCQGVLSSKDEHDKFENKLVNRLSMLEAKFDDAQEKDAKSTYDTARMDELETRMQKLEVMVQRKNAEDSQESGDLEDKISNLFEVLAKMEANRQNTDIIAGQNIVALGVLNAEMKEHRQHISETQNIIGTQHADLFAKLHQFLELLNSETKTLIDQKQSQIDKLASFTTTATEDLRNSIQLAKISFQGQHIAISNTANAIQEIRSDVLSTKTAYRDDMKQLRQLQQHLTIQLQALVEDNRKAFLKLAAEVHQKMEPFRHLMQNEGINRATAIDVETIAPVPARAIPRSNTPGIKAEVIPSNPSDHRLSAVELQLKHLRQRFDGFTMDEHIKGIVDMLRQIWPNTDVILRRLGAAELQSSALEQKIHDSIAEISTSKAGVGDVERIQASLDAVLVSIAENNPLLNGPSEKPVAVQENNSEKLDAQSFEVLRQSTEFLQFFEDMFKTQSQPAQDTLNGIKENIETSHDVISDHEQRLKQQEVHFEDWRQHFKNFKENFYQAIEEQNQKQQNNSEKIKQMQKQLNKQSQQPQRGNNLRTSDSKLRTTGNNTQSLSSFSIHTKTTSNGSNSIKTPEDSEKASNSRSSKSKHPVVDASIQSSTSPSVGNGSSKKRKVTIEDDDDD